MTIALPPGYSWLAKEPGPKMLVEALKLYGLHEAPGAVNNPTIMGWAKELGVDGSYREDAVPWCGLFMGIVAKRADKKPPGILLRALAWADFGTEAKVPMLGDVMTFKRDGGGHVGLYVGEDDKAFHILGGNQSDQVCVTRIDRGRLFKARRPEYKIQPANVRVVKLAATGSLSTNEA